MIRKLLPECGTPNRSPAGVPLTSPRTMTRSPETRTSLMSNFISGIDLAKPPTTLMELSRPQRSEEHTSELQSQSNLVCRLLLEKKKKQDKQQRKSKRKSATTTPHNQLIICANAS